MRKTFTRGFWFIGVIVLLALFVFTFPDAHLIEKLEQADKVIVEKSQSKLFLMSNGKVIKEYHIALGSEPKGHKQKEGDERTPEGYYTLDYKKSNSSFYKAIHISYPNHEDKLNAEKFGIKPGGLIMIHGQKNRFGIFSFFTQKFNWTNGCIAVTNSEMDEIWNSVSVKTPIEIRQ